MTSEKERGLQNTGMTWTQMLIVPGLPRVSMEKAQHPVTLSESPWLFSSFWFSQSMRISRTQCLNWRLLTKAFLGAFLWPAEMVQSTLAPSLVNSVWLKSTNTCYHLKKSISGSLKFDSLHSQDNNLMLTGLPVLLHQSCFHLFTLNTKRFSVNINAKCYSI